MKHNWEYRRLGDVCDVLNGYAFKSSKYISSGGIRIIRIANVQDGYISDDAPQYYPISECSHLEKFILNDGDLLISLTGNVGRVGILHNSMLPAALNQRVACIRTSGINKCFLFHFLRNKHFINDCIDSSTGIAQLNLSTEWLKNYHIPEPSMEVQEMIVAELDQINDLIAKNRELLSQLDALAQSLFYDTFGEPFTNSKAWQVKCFGDLAISINYGTSLPAVAGGTYPYLRMNNITDQGYLDLSDLKYIDIPSSDLDKCIVKKGDILFNRTNSREKVGKTALFNYSELMVIAGYIIRVRVNQAVLNPIFAVRYMNLPELKTYLRKICRGAVNQANINAKEMSSIPFLVPPLALQEDFAAKVEAIEAQKAKVEAEIAELRTLLDARMDYWFN